MLPLMMSATVNVNGRITGARDAVVSVFDHGFLYGEGIYETMRTYHGRLFLYDRHLRRLRNSARMIDLRVPFTDAELASQIRDTMASTDLGGAEAYVRVLVTRGVGDLTYDPQATPTPSVIIIVKPQVDPAPEAYARGVRVVIVDVVRNHPDTVNPMIKSNNLMNSALASQQAIQRGGFEGVMRNYRGELCECTTSNLFIVKDGAALTPPLASGLLPGITRDFLFDIGAGIGIDVREQLLRDDDLFSADEAFLTSTTREAVPIVTVDDRTIGTGLPGPVTTTLLEEFRRRAHAD
ncbi:MAG: branched-chain amino acid aminotransferase [Acidobacteria bacterium]|nr:branched-chain amino acid aminotransferase [Acidobacteriota bacterium]